MIDRESGFLIHHALIYQLPKLYEPSYIFTPYIPIVKEKPMPADKETMFCFGCLKSKESKYFSIFLGQEEKGIAPRSPHCNSCIEPLNQAEDEGPSSKVPEESSPLSSFNRFQFHTIKQAIPNLSSQKIVQVDPLIIPPDKETMEKMIEMSTDQRSQEDARCAKSTGTLSYNNTVSRIPTHFLRGTELIQTNRELYAISSENWPYPILSFGDPRTGPYYAEIWCDGMDWQHTYWALEQHDIEDPTAIPTVGFKSIEAEEPIEYILGLEQLFDALLTARRDRLLNVSLGSDKYLDDIWCRLEKSTDDYDVELEKNTDVKTDSPLKPFKISFHGKKHGIWINPDFIITELPSF